ncbi:hypothetical protein RIF29_47566 [Crotalaria pallida]|uniref:NADH-ubiquinone oxidoreductase chain 3 n=1 Tax=Crotalaria pallida TaxID=3830 RepID=A0AAN9HM68_CROPI
MLPSDFNVASVFLSVGLSTMMGLFLAFRAGRRLRGLTQDNYEEKVYDFVFDSLRDLISTRLGDLLESQGVNCSWCSNWSFINGLICILSFFFFRYAAPRARSERTKWVVVMSEFAPICIYLVISLLVSLIPLGLPFPFASNSSTYPEKLSAYECGFDPFGDARSRFDIRFYLVSILFIIPDPEVTFSFPWAVPPNKIDPFGSWSMMAFLLILTIGSLYEWKRGASDRE